MKINVYSTHAFIYGIGFKLERHPKIKLWRLYILLGGTKYEILFRYGK